MMNEYEIKKSKQNAKYFQAVKQWSGAMILFIVYLCGDIFID